MTILNYNTIEYNVVYIDPTITEPGDGTTPATALNTFPTVANKTCYIIRRTSEESAVSFPQTKSSSSLTHLLVLGMPKSESVFYPLLADEVKEAWGNDIYPYANVKMNAASYTTTASNNVVFNGSSALKLLICENCYFFRDGDGGSARDNMTSMFYFDGISDVSFSGCKFGYTQYDIDNDDYLNSNTDIATDTSKYPQYKCGSYLFAQTLESLQIDNCIINQIPYRLNNDNYNYRMHTQAFTVYNGCRKYFLLKDSTYNILNRHNASNVEVGYNSIGIWMNRNRSQDATRSIVKNLKINHIFTKTLPTVNNLRCLTLEDVNVEMENIEINFKWMKDFDVSSFNLSEAHKIISAPYALMNIKVNNIICDTTKEDSLNVSGLPVLGLFANFRPIGNPNNYIKNINIKFNDEPLRVIPTSYDVLLIEGNAYDWRPNVTWTGTDSDRYSSTGRTFLADNIIVEAYQNKGNALVSNYANIRADHIYGDVSLANTTLDVGTIKTYYSEGVGVTLSAGSYLKCNEYVANLDRYTGKAQITTTDVPSIYVNKTNAILFNEITGTGNSVITTNSVRVCPNYLVNGQLFLRNDLAFARSWNVVRTGSSSSASIKFNNNVVSVTDPKPLVLGLEPFSGIEIVPTTTGKHMFTCYLAAKNFSEAELPDCSTKCWIDVKVPETLENGVELTNIYSSIGKPWYSDNSTWSGDSGLNTYKIEFPIDVKDITKPINVKIYYKWVANSGFVYIDPDIKLTKI